MSIDFKWMSNGGLLLDGTGDIDLSNGLETVISMVRTRLKAAVDGWQLYKIGAGLDEFPGNISDSEAEITIKRRALQSIANGYIPTSAFKITTLRLGGVIQIYVFLRDELIGQASVTFNSQNVVG